LRQRVEAQPKQIVLDLRFKDLDVFWREFEVVQSSMRFAVAVLAILFVAVVLPTHALAPRANTLPFSPAHQPEQA
jgi:hypothetical protein